MKKLAKYLEKQYNKETAMEYAHITVLDNKKIEVTLQGADPKIIKCDWDESTACEIGENFGLHAGENFGFDFVSSLLFLYDNSTQAQKTQMFRGIVAEGNPISLKNQYFIDAVFQANYHKPTWYEENVIKESFTIIPDGYGNKCLSCDRVDGSVGAISWTKCVRKVSVKGTAVSAMRHIVYPQIKAFKLANTDTHCNITGEPLGEDWHADHIKPFDVLASKWLKKTNNSYEGLATLVVDVEGTIGETTFSDKELVASWSAHHQKKASLRAVTKTANLTRGKNEKC